MPPLRKTKKVEYDKVEVPKDLFNFVTSPKNYNAKSLFEDTPLFEKSADVEFLVGQPPIRLNGHKIILALSSPVFKRLFYGEGVEGEEGAQSAAQTTLEAKDAPVKIPEINPFIFQHLLRYIYSGEAINVSFMEVPSLALAAHKFEIFDLVTKCVKVGLTKNVFSIYEDVCEDKSLMVFANDLWKFICRSGKDALNLPDFLGILPETLHRLLESDELNCDELIVLQRTQAWAENHCKIKSLDIDGNSLRKVLGECRLLIRYTLLGDDNFLHNIAQDNGGLLLKHEIAKIYNFMTLNSPACLLPGMNPAKRNYDQHWHLKEPSKLSQKKSKKSTILLSKDDNSLENSTTKRKRSVTFQGVYDDDSDSSAHTPRKNAKRSSSNSSVKKASTLSKEKSNSKSKKNVKKVKATPKVEEEVISTAKIHTKEDEEGKLTLSVRSGKIKLSEIIEAAKLNPSKIVAIKVISAHVLELSMKSRAQLQIINLHELREFTLQIKLKEAISEAVQQLNLSEYLFFNPKQGIDEEFIDSLLRKQVTISINGANILKISKAEEDGDKVEVALGFASPSSITPIFDHLDCSRYAVTSTSSRKLPVAITSLAIGYCKFPLESQTLEEDFFLNKLTVLVVSRTTLPASKPVKRLPKDKDQQNDPPTTPSSTLTLSQVSPSQQSFQSQSGSGSVSVLSFLAKCPNLVTLTWNNLTGRRINFQDFVCSKKLRTLALSHAMIISSTSTVFENLENLYLFNVSWEGIEHDAATIFPNLNSIALAGPYVRPGYGQLRTFKDMTTFPKLTHIEMWDFDWVSNLDEELAKFLLEARLVHGQEHFLLSKNRFSQWNATMRYFEEFEKFRFKTFNLSRFFDNVETQMEYERVEYLDV